MNGPKIRPGSDCYFYYYSTCSKGDKCPYRHEPFALRNETVCAYWLKGRCIEPRCKFRHMHLSKNRTEIPCFYESQPSGCEKPHCPYLHEKDETKPKPKPSFNKLNLKRSPENYIFEKFQGSRDKKAGSKEDFTLYKKNQHNRNQEVGRGAKSLQSLSGNSKIDKAPYKLTAPNSNSNIDKAPYKLTAPNLSQCLAKFDGFEASLLTLFKRFGFNPKHISQLVSIEYLSFEIEGEIVCLKPQLKICSSHLGEGCYDSDSCYSIHMCIKFLLNDCFDDNCVYGHKWHTNHNDKILREFNLMPLNNDNLTHLFVTIVIPKFLRLKLRVCENYNKGKCQDKECSQLHLCLKFLTQQCSNQDECKLEHNIDNSKIKLILNSHGILTSNSQNEILLEIMDIPTIKKKILSSKYKDNSGKVLGEDHHLINDSKNFTTGKKNPNTTWSYDLNGVVKVPEICFDSVESLCPYEESGCDKLHCTHHFYWQVKASEANKNMWFNFSEKQVIFLEKAYCNPNVDTIQLPPLDPSDSLKGLLIMLKGRSLWKANFQTMEISLVGGIDVLQIRRLCSKACIFKWYFLDIINNWIEYGCVDSTNNSEYCSNITSDYIEKTYKQKDTYVDFTVRNFDYTLFFKDLSQKNLTTNVVRKVKRRPILNLIIANNEMELPPNWDIMKNEERCRRVVLASSTEEYKMIAILLQTQSQGMIYNILKIERVQNPYLYKAFQNKVQERKVTYNNEALVDIRQLFHGTDSSTVSKICEENFDWRLHGTSNGQSYGRGTYFSTLSNYSYKYATPDALGHRFIFVAKVAVGTITVGNMGMARPPINLQYNLPYDSTVEQISDPKIIVKYDKQEYYPEFIITLK